MVNKLTLGGILLKIFLGCALFFLAYLNLMWGISNYKTLDCDISVEENINMENLLTSTCKLSPFMPMLCSLGYFIMGLLMFVLNFEDVRNV